MFKFSDRTPQPLYYLAGLLALGVTAGFLAIRVARAMGDFQLTHYYFNYAEEFLRRGFLGEVLRQTGFPVTNLNISLLYSAALVLVLGLLIIACARTFRMVPGRAGLLFLFFMLACPGLTLHFAYSSFGYLDVFQLVITIAGLYAILRSGLPLAVAAAILASVLVILIHEASLISLVPVFLTALVLRFQNRFGFLPAAGVYAALLIFTIVVWRVGGADTLSFDAHVEALTAAAHTPADISDAAVLVLHRTLSDNVGLVLPRSTEWYIWQQIKFVIFAAPYLIFIGLALRMAYRHLAKAGQKLGGTALVLATIAPVFLYPIGHDYFRWCSLALTNYFLLTFVLCAHAPAYLEDLAGLIAKYRALIALGIAIGVTMGGIGGLLSFSVHTSPAAMVYRIVF